jgi:hypothetical protein
MASRWPIRKDQARRTLYHPELVLKERKWTYHCRFSMQKTQVWCCSVKSVINGVWYLQRRSWRRDKRQAFNIYLIASLTVVVWHLVWKCILCKYLDCVIN